MNYQIAVPSTLTSRMRITRLVKLGKLPKANTLKCKDCPRQAEHYDHYLGYGKNWDKIEPVCASCHVKREIKRGTHYLGTMICEHGHTPKRDCILCARKYAKEYRKRKE